MAHGTPKYKVILCGDYGVGKTSIFRRFMDNSFSPTVRATIGLDHFSKELSVGTGENVAVEIWDTGGIERFATLTSSYFQSAAAALLVYSIDSQESFSNVSQHMLEIIMHSETAKIFLCGNKCDLEGEREVTDDHIEEFMTQCDAVFSNQYEVSCKTGEGVKDMIMDMAQVMQESTNEKQRLVDPSLIQVNDQAQGPVNNSKCC